MDDDKAPDLVREAKPQGLICPHCKADPAAVNARDVAWPNGMAATVYSCGACRSIFSVHYRGQVGRQIHNVRTLPIARG